MIEGRKRINSLRSSRAKNREFHHTRLISVLLALDDRSVDELMALYKKQFGPGPARYARRTYKKWRSGKVRPTFETYRRFLVHLPQVMSFDMKCEVLRLFMEEYAGRANHELTVNVDDWQDKLTPLVQQILDKTFNAQLPKELERKLRWLGEGDMNAAQELLRASQAEESRIIVSKLHDEFENINKLLAEEHLNPRVSHVIEFPYGTISLNIKKK